MAASSRPPVKVILFDMDGLLLNTEDLYVRMRNQLIKNNGGTKTIPWAMSAEMQSMPSLQNDLDTIKYSGIDIPHEEYLRQQHKLHFQGFPSSEILPGVEQLFDTLESGLSNPPYFALTTASPKIKIEAKTSHHKSLFDKFPEHLKIVGEDARIPKGRGKPHPDIYLLALEIINKQIAPNVVKPEECLVFEDSKAGVIGARAAGMQTVWIPHQEIRKVHLNREKEFLAWPLGAEAYWDRVASIGEYKALNPDASIPSSVDLDDGWIELLDTMESFRFERYGLNRLSVSSA